MKLTESGYRSLLNIAVDLLSMVFAASLIKVIKDTFRTPGLSNALLPLSAFAGYCALIYFVRRLPHDREAFPDREESEPRRRTELIFLSIMIGTGVLLVFCPPCSR